MSPAVEPDPAAPPTFSGMGPLRRAAPAGKRVAAFSAVAICVLGLLAIPFGAVQLPENPAFMPAFGSATFIVDLLTSALLFALGRAALDHASTRLAAAYLFSVFIIIPHLLAFPGTFAPLPLIGASGTAVWLWCVWHAGFAILVCRYALTNEISPNPARRKPIQVVPVIVSTAIIVAGFTLATTIGLPYLPEIIVGHNFARLNDLGVGPFVILTNLAALILLIIRLRLRNVLAVWLTVAMIAATLDTMLTLLGAGRFTFGWYASRCLSLVTGLTVLIALLYELTTLYARTAAANLGLEILSRTDPLTQISNRRAFDEALEMEWRRCKRDQTALSILIIDVDVFKSYNDIFGHPAGDECLRKVAAALRDVPQRGGDGAARIGGEEFAILLPNTEQYGATSIANRVHASISGLNLPHSGNSAGRVTVSIGVATTYSTPIPMTAEDLVQAADHALYEAKQSGRNRTCLAASVMEDLVPLGIAV